MIRYVWIYRGTAIDFIPIEWGESQLSQSMQELEHAIENTQYISHEIRLRPPTLVDNLQWRFIFFVWRCLRRLLSK